MNTQFFTGDREYFPGISKIIYEGPESNNPLAFKYYQADKLIRGKTMADHLRFSVCYWHSFCGAGGDPFGPGTRQFPWDILSEGQSSASAPMDKAKQRLDAAFEFFTKLGVPYYCFHDRDMSPEGNNLIESEKNLMTMVELAKQRQQATGVKLLWGTANLFSHPRYMNGAATNPDFHVLSYAGAQVKAALDATVELGGENYVLWGGREGYSSLFNTQTLRETENFARFLTMVRDYGRSIGFKGSFLIEPKPMEPMKHQYDFDAQTVIGFLRHHGLDGEFKLNIEANHATLAGHTFAHELQMAADAKLLGSIDANRGDYQNGWDTDQFPTDMYDTVTAMLVVLENGGLHTGGLNFDAKLRRDSVDLEDLFIGHIGGMDSFARGLEIAAAILDESPLPSLKAQRYASFKQDEGLRFENNELDLLMLRDYAMQNGEPTLQSSKQELFENIFNQYLLK